jgi:hypothetical protein
MSRRPAHSCHTRRCSGKSPARSPGTHCSHSSCMRKDTRCTGSSPAGSPAHTKNRYYPNCRMHMGPDTRYRYPLKGRSCRGSLCTHRSDSPHMCSDSHRTGCSTGSSAGCMMNSLKVTCRWHSLADSGYKRRCSDRIRRYSRHTRRCGTKCRSLGSRRRSLGPGKCRRCRSGRWSPRCRWRSSEHSACRRRWTGRSRPGTMCTHRRGTPCRPMDS